MFTSRKSADPANVALAARIVELSRSGEIAWRDQRRPQLMGDMTASWNGCDLTLFSMDCRLTVTTASGDYPLKLTYEQTRAILDNTDAVAQGQAARSEAMKAFGIQTPITAQ